MNEDMYVLCATCIMFFKCIKSNCLGQANALLSIGSLLVHFLLLIIIIVAGVRLGDEEGRSPDSQVVLLCPLGLPLAQLQLLPGLLQLTLLGLEDEIAVVVLVELGLDQVGKVHDLLLLLGGILAGLPRRSLSGLLGSSALDLAVPRAL
jgi:hypothetical protein